MHVYLKADSTVAESDKTWSSFVKRPAGLMDVNFVNELAFPLELCWIDLVGSASPVCYGTVQPSSSKNMSSFAGHTFVLKRLMWSATAAAAAASSTGAASDEIQIVPRQRAHEWESASSLAHRDHPGASAGGSGSASLPTLQARNRLSQPAEVCSAPRWAARLVHSTMPAGLETCHGVAAAGGTVTLSGVSEGSILLARQLVGVTTIAKGVGNYSLQEQQLSADLMRRMVRAMRAPSPDGARSGAPLPPPPMRPPSPPPARRPGSAPTWQPLLVAAQADDAMRSRCEAQLRAESAEARADTDADEGTTAAALRLLARMSATVIKGGDAAATLPPLSQCGARCQSLANWSALPLGDAASSGQDFSVAAHSRALAVLRAAAPRLAAVAGGEAAVVVAAAGGALRAEGGALPPLHAALALAIGGVRRMLLKLVEPASTDGAAPPALPTTTAATTAATAATASTDADAAAWRAWACAIGVDLRVVHMSESAPSALTTHATKVTVRAADGATAAGGTADATADATTDDPTAAAAHVVLVHSAASGGTLAATAGSGAAPLAPLAPPQLQSAWDLAAAHAAEGALVVGTRELRSCALAASESRAGGRAKPCEPQAASARGVHAFVTSRELALAHHLAGDRAEALSAVDCSTCEAIATAFLRSKCDMTTAQGGAGGAGGGGAASTLPVVSVLLDLATSWPMGYRLSEQCEGLSELYAVYAVEQEMKDPSAVAALCVAYGCRSQ